MTHSSLVLNDGLKIIRQMFFIKRFQQFSHNLLVFENNHRDRIHTDDSDLLLELKVVTSLDPSELKWLSSKLKADLLNLIKVFLSLFLS